MIRPRKEPLQERSRDLVRAILDAALRVLEREGLERFNTVRVAEAAGVSVGSLYQYFPSKHAILYRLQVEEWERTSALLAGIAARRGPAHVRLRALVRAFFRTEREELGLRRALDAYAPAFQDAPETQTIRAAGQALLAALVAELAPRASAAERRFAAELTFLTIAAMGREVSERVAGPAQLERWADAVSAMLVRHLAAAGQSRAPDKREPPAPRRRTP